MVVVDEWSSTNGLPISPTIENGNLATGTTSFPTINYNHPLFLQPTDTPGSTLISLQLIRSGNYALWSRAMSYPFR